MMSIQYLNSETGLRQPPFVTGSAGFEAIFARDGRDLGIAVVGTDETVEHVPSGSGDYEPVVGGKVGKRAAVEAMSGEPLSMGMSCPWQAQT